MTPQSGKRWTVSPATARDVEWLSEWCRAHASTVAPARPGADRPDRRHAALAACIEDGCVLVGTDFEHARGIAALDLGSGSVCELAFTDENAKAALLEPLLSDIERLAVRFGFDDLKLAAPPEHLDRFAGLGYRASARAGAAAHAALTRSLARRQTRYARQVRSVLAELGIPAEYARRHRTPMQPEAGRLASIGPDVFGRDQRLVPAAARAWRGLVEAAAHHGVVLQPVSAFRTVEYQRRLLRRKIDAGQSLDEILRVSAAPGFSEHHTGRAVDVTTPGTEPLEEPFERTVAYGWLRRNAHTHGFRLSYPRGNRHGFAYEPWHWFYTG